MVNTLNQSMIELQLNEIQISNCEADIGPVIRVLGGSNSVQK